MEYPVWPMPTRFTSQGGKGFNYVFEDKVYNVSQRRPAEVMVDGYMIPLLLYDEILNLSCSSDGCTATAKAFLRGDECIFDQHFTGHNHRCGWNPTTIRHEYYRKEMYAGLRSRRFRDLDEAYDWAITEQLRYFPPQCVDTFPMKDKFKSNAKIIKKFQGPKLPQNDAELPNLIIPPRLLMTNRPNVPLLLFRHSFQHPLEGPAQLQGPPRIETMFVFGSLFALHLLCHADTLYCDGTFKTCPKPFAQMYILHRLFGDRMRPMLWCLLTRKTEYMYNILFEQIVAFAALHHIAVNWVRFRSDFEVAATNAIRTHFPAIEILGCYFHFCSAVYKRVLQLGLSIPYNDPDTHVKNTVRACMALAFLPPYMVFATYQAIKHEYEQFVPMPNTEKANLDTFYAYFDNTWLRTAAIRAQWNVSSIDGHRTNNNVEGYHSKLISKMGIFLQDMNV